MHYYAQIDSGKVVAVTQASGPIDSPNMVSIAEFDRTLIGATYASGVFTRVVVSPVPQSVTMRQARLALLGAGKLAEVDTAIAALSEPTRTAAQIEWEYSNEVQRSNGIVSQLGPALGLTEAQIDALFVAAAAL
jgi:hypothetical protein